MEEQKMRMKQIGFFVTKRCNLKCRLCSGHVPYICGGGVEIPVKKMKNIVDEYFGLVDYVEKLVISGGETFLYDDLSELLQYIYERHSNNYGFVEIFTNGTIIPPNSVLDILKDIGEEKKRVVIYIDDYGKKLSVRAKELAQELKSRGIDYVLRPYNEENAHCGGWVDFGDLRKERNSVERVKNCVFLNGELSTMCTYDGVLYPCTPARVQVELNMHGKRKTEKLDLLDQTLSREQKREKLQAWQKREMHEACKYCDGMYKEARHYLPAVQLTTDELKYVKAGARNYYEVLEMKARMNDE